MKLFHQKLWVLLCIVGICMGLIVKLRAFVTYSSDHIRLFWLCVLKCCSTYKLVYVWCCCLSLDQLQRPKCISGLGSLESHGRCVLESSFKISKIRWLHLWWEALVSASKVVGKLAYVFVLPRNLDNPAWSDYCENHYSGRPKELTFSFYVINEQA